MSPQTREPSGERADIGISMDRKIICYEEAERCILTDTICEPQLVRFDGVKEKRGEE